MTVRAGTFTINAALAGEAAGFFDTGLLARWEADAGVTYDGEAPTEWTDSELALEIVDFEQVSILTPSPAGPNTLAFTPSGGMQGVGSASLPTGAEPRTWGLCGLFHADQFGFCGVGQGATSGAYTSFIPGINNDGTLALDFRGDRLSTEINITEEFHTVFGTYDGTTATLYLDGEYVDEVEVELNTGSDLLNFFTTFSGIATAGRLAAVACWDDDIGAINIAAVDAFWRAKYITSTAAPIASNIVIDSLTTSVSIAWSFDSNKNGVKHVIFTETEGMPSVDQMLAGQDSAFEAAAYWLPDSMLSANNDGVATGLEPETAYHGYTLLEDESGLRRVVYLGAETTAAADVTPPNPSSGSIAKVLNSGYAWQFDADVGNGTTYIYVTPSSDTPSNATVETGTAVPITSTGTKSGSGAWPEDTTGYGWVLHVSASGLKEAAPTALGNFTTDASSDLTPDETVNSAANLVSLLDSWEADWAGTVPDGKTSSDERIIGCTFSTGSTLALNGYDFSVASSRRRVTIRMVGTWTVTGSGANIATAGPFLWTGLVNMVQSKNMRLLLCHTQGEQRIRTAGSEDVTIERCYIQGTYGDLTLSNGSGMPSTGFGFSIDPPFTASGLTAVRLSLVGNLIAGFWNAGIILFGACDGMLIENNVFDNLSHDDIKFNGGGLKKNVTLRGNWGCRFKTAVTAGTGSVPSGGFHEDYHQIETTDFENLVVEDTIVWKGTWGGQAAGVYQSFFANGSYGIGVDGNGFRYERCLTLGDGSAFYYDRCNLTGSRPARHCAFIFPSGGIVNPTFGFIAQQIAGGPSERDYNITCAATGQSNGSQGTNGLHIDMGDKFAPTYTALLAIFDAVPTVAGMIELLYPKEGAKLHWDFGASRCQASDMLERIFVDGLHPENVGAPVAGLWHARWNANSTGLLPTSYTGTFDGDGNNTPAP